MGVAGDLIAETGLARRERADAAAQVSPLGLDGDEARRRDLVVLVGGRLRSRPAADERLDAGASVGGR